MTRMVRSVLIACCALGWAGCEATPLQKVRDAYERADYASACQHAVPLIQGSSGAVKHEAAYLAGMGAYHLQERVRAQQWLRIAVHSASPITAGRSMAQLGLIHNEQGNYALAAHRLLEAAKRLKEEDQARSYLNAATAQQKLGRWSEAALNLAQVRRISDDLSLCLQAQVQMRYSGYTIQIGAFAVEGNARRAARRITVRAGQLQLNAPRLVRAVDADGRKLILVQVGRFSDHASADAMRRRLITAADVVPIVEQVSSRSRHAPAS